MSRNDTNTLLKAIADNAHRYEDYPDFYVTVGVDGNLVTGIAISEEEFFELDENNLWKEFFTKNIQEPRMQIIEKLDNGEEVEFPEALKEYFLYLKNAKYIQNGMLVPDGETSLSMQIRVSDISTVSLVQLGKTPIDH